MFPFFFLPVPSFFSETFLTSLDVWSFVSERQVPPNLKFSLRRVLSGQSDRIEILFGPQSFLARQKLTSAIGLAMFCKQRRFGTPRTVHHAKSWLKLSFYRTIRIYQVDFEKIYNISSMLFIFFFFFFFF